MKKNLLIAALAIFGCATGFAQDIIKGLYSVQTDVTLRNDGTDGANADKAYPNVKDLEMRTSRTDGEINVDFVALMSFNIPVKDGYDISKATLVLYTERAKGTMAIYPFNATISDADTYNSQKDNLAAARELEAIATQKLNGTNNKAVTDDGASNVLNDWRNEIDITSYVKEIGNGDVNLLLCNNAESTTTAIKVYSSDAQDVTLKDNTVFEAEKLVPQLIVEYTPNGEIPGQQTCDVQTDVTLRNDGTDGANADKAYPSVKDLEMRTSRTDGEINVDFVALMSFNVSIPEDAEISKATLVLYTERAKGTMAVYPFNATISNEDTYNSQKDNLAAARELEAIATQRLNGTNNKAVTDDGASNVLSDWRNEIDITDYVKEVGNGNVNLMLCNNAESTTNAIKVYSSDAQDVTLKDGTIFKAEDLVPQLVVNYTTATGINEVEAVEPVAKGKEGIYTLSGVRVAKADQPGIYIINGKKVLVGRK